MTETRRQIINRKEAKQKGLKRYFTGKPCKYGHLAERFVSTSTCVTCSQEKAAATKRENRSQYSEADKRYRLDNIEDHVRRYKTYYQLNKESHQAYMTEYRSAN